MSNYNASGKTKILSLILLLCCISSNSPAASDTFAFDMIKVKTNQYVKQCHYPKDTMPAKHLSIIQYNSQTEKSITTTYTTTPISSVSHPQVLLLAYSRCLDKGKLLVKDSEILGAYEVPAVPRQPTTRLGSASALQNQMEIQSNFLTENLDKQIKQGNHLFYIQLGLLDKKAYIQQDFRKITLSNIHQLIVSNDGCPTAEEIQKQLSEPNAVCKTY